MAEIAFYHLQRSSLETVLPKLLEKTLSAGKRAVVVAASKDRVESLNSHLWNADPAGWLPHGSEADGHPSHQPIWLTTEVENPNGASFLFLTDGVDASDLNGWERCFDLFDGRDDAAVAAARERWKALSQAGHTLTYWQQSEAGKWEKNG